MDDEQLMVEILSALWEDTAENVPKLSRAVKEQDRENCIRFAHYSKGACANLGANRAAAMFWRIESQAKEADFAGCARSLSALEAVLEELKAEIDQVSAECSRLAQ